MVHSLECRLAHLLTLSAPRTRLRLRLCLVMFPETHIHICLYRGSIFRNIVNHTLLDGPTEKIQLAHRGFLNWRVTAHLKTDPFATAKGIKEPLRIRLELALVMEVNHELAILQRIKDVELLGVIRHEPIDKPQTHGRLSC